MKRRNKEFETSSIIEISSPIEAENIINYLDVPSKILNCQGSNDCKKKDVLAYYGKISPSKDNRKDSQNVSKSEYNKRKSSLKKQTSKYSTDFSSMSVANSKSR